MFKIKVNFKRIINRLASGLCLLGLLILLTTGAGPSKGQAERLNILSAKYTFNFITWELRALSQKLGYGLLAPERFLSDEDRSLLVLSYFERIWEINKLGREIEQLYAAPAISQPKAESASLRARQTELRSQTETERPIIEAIMAEQVNQTLVSGDFGILNQILPPVNGVISPLPYLLIISPRDHIESIYQRELITGLTTEQQVALENRIEAAEPELSAYITAIGGLSAYPAMLQETTSIPRLADVLAHEWTHHYLMPRPLGWNYLGGADTRTINETTASLIGGWAGDETIRRCYRPQIDWDKPLPDTLDFKAPILPPAFIFDETEDPEFDFSAEMHKTRVETDRLLATDNITAAERYLEERQQVFVEAGYQIRRLNQAYFAFHGAYANHSERSAGGASGSDPVGPTVYEIWRLSSSPREFVRKIGQTTTLTEVLALKAELLASHQDPAQNSWSEEK